MPIQVPKTVRGAQGASVAFVVATVALSYGCGESHAGQNLFIEPLRTSDAGEKGTSDEASDASAPKASQGGNGSSQNRSDTQPQVTDPDTPSLIDAGFPLDAAPPDELPRLDAGVPRDASAPSDDEDAAMVTKVRCGGGNFNEVTCLSPAEKCCSKWNAAGGYAYSCIPKDTPCQAGLVIGCARQSDCSSRTVCCYDGTITSSERVACVPPTSCTNGALLCDPDANPSECTDGKRCTSYGLNVPYSVCR